MAQKQINSFPLTTVATDTDVVHINQSGIDRQITGANLKNYTDQTDTEIKTAYENNADTNAFTDAEQTKLTGIETSAKDDQTDAEIKTAYENNADTNAFTDAEQTKLAGIEDNATADQTKADIDALNINADQVDGLEGATLRDGSTSQAYACSNLAFPATQAASANPNTLDDYEEGTWTPTLEGATTAGSATYISNSGAYTKVGNTVWFRSIVTLSSKGGMVGPVQIKGLPFTPSSTLTSVTIGYSNDVNATSALIVASGISLYDGASLLSGVSITDTFQIYVSGTYSV
jgi:hypothetical protein